MALDCTEWAKPVVGIINPALHLDTQLSNIPNAVKSVPIRINTNGLSDLINGEKTARKLEGLIDTVSISLNATNKEDYLEVVRSKFGIKSFEKMLEFTRDCVKFVPNVVMTVVDTVTSKENQEKALKICEDLGATLRIRPLE